MRDCGNNRCRYSFVGRNEIGTCTDGGFGSSGFENSEFGIIGRGTSFVSIGSCTGCVSTGGFGTVTCGINSTERMGVDDVTGALVPGIEYSIGGLVVEFLVPTSTGIVGILGIVPVNFARIQVGRILAFPTPALLLISTTCSGTGAPPVASSTSCTSTLSGTVLLSASTSTSSIHS